LFDGPTSPGSEKQEQLLKFRGENLKSRPQTGGHPLHEERLVLQRPHFIVLPGVDLLNAPIHGKDVGAVDDLRMRPYAANQRCQGGEDCR
jgi:hypothetical protein